jgi:hypothetical protein
VIGIALYEMRQTRSRPPIAPTAADTIAAADAQTAQWLQWNQETSEDETVMEPLLPGLEDYAIDPSPMPLDQGDRASIQALMVLKGVANWLEGEAVNYGDETGQAIGHLAGRLRSMGLDVLER